MAVVVVFAMIVMARRTPVIVAVRVMTMVVRVVAGPLMSAIGIIGTVSGLTTVGSSPSAIARVTGTGRFPLRPARRLLGVIPALIVRIPLRDPSAR